MESNTIIKYIVSHLDNILYSSQEQLIKYQDMLIKYEQWNFFKKCSSIYNRDELTILIAEGKMRSSIIKEIKDTIDSHIRGNK